MNDSIQIELDGLRAELHRVRGLYEEALRGKYPERGEEKTLRDEFAIQSPWTVEHAVESLRVQGEDAPSYERVKQRLATMRYKQADAMLEARKK
jgi:hypothetical protein